MTPIAHGVYGPDGVGSRLADRLPENGTGLAVLSACSLQPCLSADQVTHTKMGLVGPTLTTVS
jgi:hypothetical protein